MTGPAGSCPYCDGSHEPRWLCDPAKRVLDALQARGTQFNMPDIDFGEPIPASELFQQLGLAPDDRLVSQLVVYAGIVPVAGTVKPLLAFSGRDVYGRLLPRWVYPGSAGDLRNAVRLIRSRAELAIVTAKKS